MTDPALRLSDLVGAGWRVRTGGRPVRRLSAARAVAPIPVGWRAHIWDETWPDSATAPTHTYWTWRPESLRREVERAGWEVADNVSGWVAVPPPVPLDPATDGVDAVTAAVLEAWRNGRATVMPTDTVMGLCLAADAPAAGAVLRRTKGRGESQPFAVLVASLEQAEQLAVLSDAARSVLTRGWPGALTAVLPRRAGVDLDLGGSADTIGLRCPGASLVRDLVAIAGPVIATSANPAGSPTASTWAVAADGLWGVEVLVVGEPGGRQASTVVDLTGAEPVVLRQGDVSADDLRAWWSDPAPAGQADGSR